MQHCEECCENVEAFKDTKICLKRHPKVCKVFALDKRCRFGEDCSYRHASLKASNETCGMADQIKNLESCIK